jgi:ACS family hexuronate transporter-like MFS transporter
MTAKRAWTITIVATAAMAISYIDRQALAALAPRITKELDLSETAYGWLNSGFSIAYLIASPFAGRWIDVMGARRGLPLAIVAWSLVAAAHALAPDIGSLLTMRILLGFAEAPTLPAGAQTVQLVFKPADRARGMSMLFAGMSIGSALAPLLAIRIADHTSWRVSFAVVAAIAVAWLPLWALVTARRALPDPPAMAAADRMPWHRLVRTPAMLRGIVGLVAIIPASTIALAWGAKFFASRHFEADDYATYLMVSGLAYDLGAIGFGDLASRRTARRGDDSPARGLLLVAALLACASACGMAAPGRGAMVVACVVALSIGRGAYTALVNADTLARVPEAAISTAAGLIASAQSLVILAVSPIIGASIDAGGYGPILVAIGVFVLPGCVAWMMWPVTSSRK